MVELTVIGDINAYPLKKPLRKPQPRNQKSTTKTIDSNLNCSPLGLVLASARLGLETQLVSRMSEDMFADYLLGTISENKVASKVKVLSDGGDGIKFAVFFRDRNRAIINYKGTGDGKVIDFNLLEIEGKVLTIFGLNLFNDLRKDATKLINQAKGKGLKVGLDPRLGPENLTEQKLNEIYGILKIIDWLFLDIDEGEGITYTKNDVLMVKKLISMGTQNVFLLEGYKGCLFGGKDYIKFIPAFGVESSDKSPTGDVFSAAFVKAYLSAYSLEDAVKFANCAVALSAGRTGLEKYPSLKEVKDFAVMKF